MEPDDFSLRLWRCPSGPATAVGVSSGGRPSVPGGAARVGTVAEDGGGPSADVRLGSLIAALQPSRM